MKNKFFVVGITLLFCAGVIFFTSSDPELPETALTASVHDAVSEENPVLYVAPVEERTVVPISGAQLVVTVVDEVILEENDLSAQAAQTVCERIAYNTDYMWKQIVCTFEGEEIYNDIFIAG